MFWNFLFSVVVFEAIHKLYGFNHFSVWTWSKMRNRMFTKSYFISSLFSIYKVYLRLYQIICRDVFQIFAPLVHFCLESPLIVMGFLPCSPFSESQDKEKAACEVLCHADYDRRWPLAGPAAWCGDSRGRSPGLGHGDRAGAGREEGDGGGEGAEGARQDSRGAAAARRLQSARRARTARWVTPHSVWSPTRKQPIGFVCF